WRAATPLGTGLTQKQFTLPNSRLSWLSEQMDKEHIISEIRRTANANGGVALGWRRFEQETTIRYYDWFGQFWTRWGDAVREAGFEPNRMNEAYDEEFVLKRLLVLTRSLGRVPTRGDLLLARKS